MTVKVEIEISRETLENIFVTALEGGSNYWYYLTEETCNEVRKAVPNTEEECLSVAIFKAVFDKGISVTVNDAEDEDDVLGVISMETMPERLQHLANDKLAFHLTDEINGDGDAESSDVIFQYIVLNDLVYA